jgi:hydrogenase nickel incorporation protein HypA/HybF
MDERELANRVLEIVDDSAYHISARRILGIHLAIGGLRSFNVDLLHTIFRDVSVGTVAESAKLFVQVLPVRHHCQNCGTNFDASRSEVPCPACSHPHTEIVGGEELRVTNMEIDDTAA